jgi:nucleotide-binding universal stress UspA family protein
MSSTQHKIIVATDFSEGSKKALALATWFADTFHSEILLLSVVEPHRSFLGGTDVAAEEAHRKAAERQLQGMVQGSGFPNISMLIRSGKPYTEIVEAARESFSELIFMGTSGINTMSEMFLGSNAGRVARMAECPVVTVHPGAAAPRPVRRVLIPVDPRFGIRELRDFFAKHPSWRPSVDLLCVSTSKEDNMSQMEDHLRRQQDMFNRLGFTDVQFRIVSGEAVSSAILAHAEDNKDKLDLVMMETKGRKGLQGWFIGSVTEEVISFSPVPVFSLKPDRRDDHTSFSGENLPI